MSQLLHWPVKAYLYIRNIKVCVHNVHVEFGKTVHGSDQGIGKIVRNDLGSVKSVIMPTSSRVPRWRIQ